MKKFFSAITALILVFGITACSNSVQKNDPEPNITTEPTASVTDSAETSVTVQVTPAESNSAEIMDTENNTTTTEKSTTKPSRKPDNSATTQKPVTTTKKPQTTKAPSKKLPGYSPEAEIVELFDRINSYREQNGLEKLSLDTDLCKMAYIRAQEQLLLKGHTRPDNSKYYSILDEYNYSYMGCGENIAFVQELSPENIFSKWKGSSAHNGNMIESRWTKSGIALYQKADGSYIIVHLFAC